MNDKLQSKSLKVAIEKRILNEFSSKILNEEKMDKVVESRRSNRLSTYSEMPFHCECDDAKCNETILMSTQEYERIHNKTKYFIVIPSHVRLDLEEIITSFNNYVLVGKFFPHRQG